MSDYLSESMNLLLLDKWMSNRVSSDLLNDYMNKLAEWIIEYFAELILYINTKIRSEITFKVRLNNFTWFFNLPRGVAVENDWPI